MDYEKLDFIATLDDFSTEPFFKIENNQKSILRNIVSRAVNHCYDRKSDILFSCGEKIKMMEFTRVVITDNELREKAKDIIKQNLPESDYPADNYSGMLVDMKV